MRNIIITHGDGLNFYDAYFVDHSIPGRGGSFVTQNYCSTYVRPVSGAVRMPLTCTKTKKKNLTDLTTRKVTQFEGDKGGEDDAARQSNHDTCGVAHEGMSITP